MLSGAALLAAACGALSPATAEAQRVIEVEYTPTGRAQIAIWVTDADGTYLRTLALTASVAFRGIGNRPGALQMNSGFHWPYGRREGVLPVWAHARAGAPDAQLFPRVIFQDRYSEGHASRSTNDYSRDDYFCLSFNAAAAQRDQLDAVSCASAFNSDKGRYLTTDDVTRGYAEPATVDGAEVQVPLDLFSLYPPRRDAARCESAGCYDRADVALYDTDARRVMPEIDAVTTATPPANTPQHVLFSVPDEWPNGDYQVFLEINVEGDHNDTWSETRYPTPTSTGSAWDYWAESYGYPYRGQPSVIYRTSVYVGGNDERRETQPAGYGDLDGRGSDGGAIFPMDPTITNDPIAAPGSGMDRLRTVGDVRYTVRSQAAVMCADNTPPSEIRDLSVSAYHSRHDAHRFAHLSFVAPSDDTGVRRIDVRVGTAPITDVASFERALPAFAADASNPDSALTVPVLAAGQTIELDFGGMNFEQQYYIGVRAVDSCNAAGPIAVVEYTTPAIQFTTVSPCFVATAAYGSPLAERIGTLRHARDRHLRGTLAGDAFVELYGLVGPTLAAHLDDVPGLREGVVSLLDLVTDALAD